MHKQKLAVIYHSADFDGIASREVCNFWLLRRFESPEIHSYPWDYGQPEPVPKNSWDDYALIFIVDLSVDSLMCVRTLQHKIIWIDHHKTAIDKWDVNEIPEDGKLKGYRIDGVAACRLCWQYFWKERSGDPRPTLQEFKARTVSEPYAIQLLGEHDVWDHRDEDSIALQFGLRALNESAVSTFMQNYMTCFIGEALPSDIRPSLVEVIENGWSIKAYCDKQNFLYSRSASRTVKWKGLRFCMLNSPTRNSSVFDGVVSISKHDALFRWHFDGDFVNVSLYHAPGGTEHDLSKIAKEFGGGGHRGACGFRMKISDFANLVEIMFTEI